MKRYCRAEAMFAERVTEYDAALAAETHVRKAQRTPTMDAALCKAVTRRYHGALVLEAACKLLVMWGYEVERRTRKRARAGVAAGFYRKVRNVA